MANNRLYLINRRLGIEVYVARFPAMGQFFEVVPGLEDRLRLAFAEDHDGDWSHDHGWELVDEGVDTNELRTVKADA